MFRWNFLGRGRGEWGLYVAYILHNFKAWAKKSRTIRCLLILFDALQSSRYNFEKFIYYIMEICCAPSQSGYSSTEIWIELEFGNVGF